MTTLSAPPLVSNNHNSLSKSNAIYEYTHISVSSLVVAFDYAKAKRGNPRGILTDQEQDILRAALVMACAGVDAVLKQTIRDSLEALIDKHNAVREGFEKFIRKRISGEDGNTELAAGAKFLASVLVDRHPRPALIELYIRELTGDSLQSAEEISRTAAALGLDIRTLKLDVDRLKDIFKIRNKIIHELDIDLTGKTRKRRVRSQSDLLENAGFILETTRSVVDAVGARL